MSVDDLQQVQAVSFDMGQTLVEVHPSVGQIYQRVLRLFGIEISDTAAVDRAFFDVFGARTAARPDLRSSSTIERDFWRGIVDDLLGAHFSEGRVPEPIYIKMWSAFESTDCWRPLPGAGEVLERLRARGFKLAVLSNWDERLHPLLKQLRWARHFDFIGISSEIGWSKPAPEAFQAVADGLALPPAVILHVGDSLGSDVRGAQRAGLRAVWLQPDSGRQQEDVRAIASLQELPDLLQC
ncbi:MAG: HAD-IA family hydrolase [Opitutales bacterium]